MFLLGFWTLCCLIWFAFWYISALVWSWVAKITWDGFWPCFLVFSPETLELSFLGGPLPEVLFDLDFEFLELLVVMLIIAGAPKFRIELFCTTWRLAAYSKPKLENCPALALPPELIWPTCPFFDNVLFYFLLSLVSPESFWLFFLFWSALWSNDFTAF